MNAKEKIRILCVDDDHDLSARLDLYAKEEVKIEHLGTVSKLDKAMEKISRDLPDIVVVDLSVVGSDPIAVIREMGKRFPEIRVILYSSQDDQELIDEAIEAGAFMHVHKEDGVKILLDAIYKAADVD